MTADLVFAVLVVEHWLSHQKWINAKSIIGLLILLFVVVVTVDLKLFKRGK